MEYFNFYDLVPQTAVAAYVGDKFCSDKNIITQPLCATLFSFCGLDYARINKVKIFFSNICYMIPQK